MSFPFYLASRAFLDRRHGAWGWLIGWLATGSMAVGVAALIITLAVMSGFRDDIRSKILGVQPHLILTTFSNMFSPIDPDIKKVLGESSAVKAFAPYVSGQGLIGATNVNSGAMIKGVDPEREPAVTGLDKKVVQGVWKDLVVPATEKPSIFLGVELARNIGARVGDVVWIVVPEAMKMSMMGMPQAHRFVVRGIVQTGLYDYDSSLAFIHIQQAQQLFDMGTMVSGMGIHISDPDDSVRVAKDLQERFEGHYWVRSWLSLNKNLFSALKLEKTVMFIILTLVTTVASVMIISNLLLIITQKVKEIGIIRAMGATSGTIRKWFLYQGLLMGLVGNIIGIILGVGISAVLAKTNLISLPADVYYIDHVPVHLAWTDIAMVSLVSAVIVLFASLYPASRAAKLDPIEAIRYG